MEVVISRPFCDFNTTCMIILQTIQSPCQWFTLIFVIISIPVYILFMVMLIKFRKVEPMNSLFFRILFSLAVADLLTLIAYYPRLLTNTTDRQMYVCVCVCVCITNHPGWTGQLFVTCSLQSPRQCSFVWSSQCCTLWQ
jgi:hypothetical protein